MCVEEFKLPTCTCPCCRPGAMKPRGPAAFLPTQEASVHAAQHPLCAARSKTRRDQERGAQPSCGHSQPGLNLKALRGWEAGEVWLLGGWGRLPLSQAGSASAPSPSEKEGRGEKYRVFINSSSPS